MINDRIRQETLRNASPVYSCRATELTTYLTCDKHFVQVEFNTLRIWGETLGPGRKVTTLTVLFPCWITSGSKFSVILEEY